MLYPEWYANRYGQHLQYYSRSKTVSTTTLAHPPASSDSSILVVERILRDRESIWQQIRSEYHINQLIRQMLLSSTIALGCYGAVLGASKSPLQALASAIKLPTLFFLTLAICLPTLYLFNLLFGARLSVRQSLAIVLVAISVTAVLTLAFAPISLFFLITAPSYAFFKLLNVAILTLTGSVGLGFLVGGMRSMNRMAHLEQAALIPAEPPAGASVPAAPTDRPVSMGLLNVWIVLYAFVGTQLGWTLRPFFGDPGQPFEIFRSIEGNFYVNVVHTLINLLK
jgi:hypothetical protein